MLVKTDANLNSAKWIQLPNNYLISDLDEGEIIF